MISDNISTLRKRQELSQEALAEKVGVSRQTVAKWESGESVPDILHAEALAELFDVNLEDLIRSDLSRGAAPSGKYLFGTVTVGDKGQIVIPVKARRLFNIRQGDDLVVLGDINQGLALLKSDLFIDFAHQLQNQEEKP